MNPPRQALTWDEIVNMATLGDFDLLRDVKNSILSKSWTNSNVREAMTFHFRLKRAREEIQRLNVEIRRQTTYMQAEYLLYARTVHRLQAEDPHLSAYMNKEATYRSTIFSNVTYYLLKASQLPNFSGTLQPGRRKDSLQAEPSDEEKAIFPNWLSQLRGEPVASVDRSAPEKLLAELTDLDNEERDSDDDGDDSDDDGESDAILDMAERLILS
jgi:hypothetical protein